MEVSRTKLVAAKWALAALLVFFCTVQTQNIEPFSCDGRPNGYYADISSGCQIYHMCDGLGRQFSYSCPNTTLFQQRMLICDHWYMVNCSKAELDYGANLLIGQREKPFVEDDAEHPYHRTPRPDLLAHPSAAEYNIIYRTGRAQEESDKRNLVGVDNTKISTDSPAYFLPSHWSTEFSRGGAPVTTEKSRKKVVDGKKGFNSAVNYKSDFKATTPVYPKAVPKAVAEDDFGKILQPPRSGARETEVRKSNNYQEINFGNFEPKVGKNQQRNVQKENFGQQKNVDLKVENSQNFAQNQQRNFIKYQHIFAQSQQNFNKSRQDVAQNQQGFNDKSQQSAMRNVNGNAQSSAQNQVNYAQNSAQNQQNSAQNQQNSAQNQQNSNKNQQNSNKNQQNSAQNQQSSNKNQQNQQNLTRNRQNFNENRQSFNENRQNVNENRQNINENRQNFNENRQNFNENRQNFNENRQNFNENRQNVNENRQNVNENRQNQQSFNKNQQNLPRVNFRSNFKATTPVYPKEVTPEVPLSFDEAPLANKAAYGLPTILEPPKTQNSAAKAAVPMVRSGESSFNNPSSVLSASTFGSGVPSSSSGGGKSSFSSSFATSTGNSFSSVALGTSLAGNSALVNFASNFPATTPVYPKSVTPEVPIAVSDDSSATQELSRVILPPIKTLPNSAPQIKGDGIPSMYFQPPRLQQAQQAQQVQQVPITRRVSTVDQENRWDELRKLFLIPDYEFPLDSSASRPSYEQGTSSFQVNPFNADIQQRNHA